MNRFLKAIAGIGIALAMIFGMTACSTVNTAPDAVALHYSGGSFESQKFVECVPASTRQINGPGEHYYYYPIGERTFSFTGKEAGAESDPIMTNTKDSQQVAVSGYVAFEFVVDMKEAETDLRGEGGPNKGVMDCAELRKFHDRIGYKSKAYFEGNPDVMEIGVEGNEKGRGTGDNAEWRAFLNQYLKTPIDMVMDDNGQQYGWRELFQDQASQIAFRDGVAKDLPVQVNKGLQSSTFFKVTNVVISTPKPDQSLLDALKQTEVAKENNNAQIEQNKVAETKYSSMKECKDSGLSEETCVTLKVIEEGDIPFYILPDGSDVMVNSAPAPAPEESKEG